MRTLSTIAITSCACLSLAGCGESGGKVTKVEPRPEPTEKIESPDAAFNASHTMQATSSVQAPADKKKKKD